MSLLDGESRFRWPQSFATPFNKDQRDMYISVSEPYRHSSVRLATMKSLRVIVIRVGQGGDPA